MICTLENLSPDNQEKLKAWLARGEYSLLEQVAEAQVKRFEAEFCNDALRADAENKFDISANVALKEAQKFNTFLTVLRSFKAQAEPYQKAKLT